MKLQSSIEFLAILSVVAIFCVAVLGLYISFNHSQKSEYSALDNYTAINPQSNTSSVASGGIYLYGSIPSQILINKSNNFEVLLSYPSDYKVAKVTATSGTTILPSQYGTLNYSPIDVLSFSALPSKVGPVSINITAEFVSQNSTVDKSVTLQSFAALSGSGGTNGTAEFNVKLVRNNESIIYPLQKPAGIDRFSTLNHCAWYDFWGNREGVDGQCGSYNAWGFVVGDGSCNWWRGTYDRYYCIYPGATGTNEIGIGTNDSAHFNTTLYLRNSSSLYTANLSSANESSSLFKSGSVTGSASSNGVFFQPIAPYPYYTYAVLQSSQGTTIVPLSNYSRYSTNVSQLESTLKLYNNSGVSGQTFQYVMSGIAFANQSEEGLVNAKAVSNGCSISGLSFVCKPATPFEYTIDVAIDNSTANQSVPYLGSVINIK